MQRKCEKIIASKDGSRAIYIDSLNKAEIVNYISQDRRHSKKFKFIAEIILDGHRNKEVYSSESINNRSKDVTAMKFFKGQENDRIYCKEVKTKDGIKVVVASILHERKKQKKIKSKEISIINKVALYHYEV